MIMQFLDIADLMAMFKVSEPTIYRWVKAGSIPAPIRLGRRAIRWRASDIEAFVSAQSTTTEEEEVCPKQS